MNLRPFSMSLSALLIPAAIVATAPVLHAQEDETFSGEPTGRCTSVRVLEGAATIRKYEVEDELSRAWDRHFR